MQMKEGGSRAETALSFLLALTLLALFRLVILVERTCSLITVIPVELTQS